MKKLLYLVVIIAILTNCKIAFTKDKDEIKIKLGTSYANINSRFGAPIEEDIKSSFWGNRKALYKLGEGNYCIIKYNFGRVKNVLFLEQISEDEAKEHLKEKGN